VAQRRFEPIGWRAGSAASEGGRELYPCVGVFVIDGQVAGAYGRAASERVVDHRAQDVAVLVSSADAADEVTGAIERTEAAA
jgi:hypothetical protein